MYQEQVKIIATGLVQGVNFRYYTREKADELGLVGWVMNLPDGNLEIIAQGERKNLEKLIKWCQTGPQFARVKEINIEWQKPEGKFNDFQIEY